MPAQAQKDACCINSGYRHSKLQFRLRLIFRNRNLKQFRVQIKSKPRRHPRASSRPQDGGAIEEIGVGGKPSSIHAIPPLLQGWTVCEADSRGSSANTIDLSTVFPAKSEIQILKKNINRTNVLWTWQSIRLHCD